MSRRRLDDDAFDAEAVDEEGLPLVRLFMTSLLRLYVQGLPGSMWHRKGACHVSLMLQQAAASLPDKWRRIVAAVIRTLFSFAVLLPWLTEGLSPFSACRSTMREGLTNSGEASGQNWLVDGLVSQAWQVWLKLSKSPAVCSSSSFQDVSSGLRSLDWCTPEIQQKLLPYW